MSEMRSFIESCLLGAKKEIEKSAKAGLKIKVKGRNDWASSADMAAEKFVVGRIRKEFPGSVVLSEESYTQAALEADSLFVIDPIDGTHNFIAGIPLYGVSLAHYSGGKPTAGGVYLIPDKTLMYAEKGKGATSNGKKMQVSRTRKLEDFFLLGDSRLHIAQEMGMLGKIVEIEAISQHTRFIGAAIYEMGYVACGRVDATIDFKLKPYDFAAAAFIVERAGGKVTDLEGRGWNLSTARFLCSNGLQHQRILDILNGRE